MRRNIFKKYGKHFVLRDAEKSKTENDVRKSEKYRFNHSMTHERYWQMLPGRCLIIDAPSLKRSVQSISQLLTNQQKSRDLFTDLYSLMTSLKDNGIFRGLT